MNALPNGWAIAQIGGLIAGDGLFVDGDWVESKDQDPNGDVRLTQLADVGDGVFRDRSNRFLTSEKARELGCTYLAAGDVLVARMPEPLGRACIFPGDPRPCVTAVDVCIIRPGSGGVDPRWLMWSINAPQFRREILARQAGTTRKRISRKNLAAIEFPIPPPGEQRRIAAAIEEQFSRVDTGDALLRRAAARIRVMRDAVYTKAAEGPWPTTPLSALLREPLRNGHSAKASRDGRGVRTLTLTAVTYADFSEENTKVTTANPERVSDLWLEPGDILIERSNTPELVGTAALYRGPRSWAIFPDLLIRVRVSDDVRPEFLEIVLKARPARHYFQRAAGGIAGSMPKVDQGDVSRLPVPLPEPDEQRDIIAEVERQLSIVDAMAAETSRAIRRSAGLRRSIFEQAFTGKLVPQDPSDEPASVILERIAADRAAAPKPSRRSARIPA